MGPWFCGMLRASEDDMVVRTLMLADGDRFDAVSPSRVLGEMGVATI